MTNTKTTNKMQWWIALTCNLFYHYLMLFTY